MERCTAHGIQMSQVTTETRIVLTWSSIIEGGMTTSATMLMRPVPLSFAKTSVRRVGHPKLMDKKLDKCPQLSNAKLKI